MLEAQRKHYARDEETMNHVTTQIQTNLAFRYIKK
jgi:hypothetical protein